MMNKQSSDAINYEVKDDQFILTLYSDVEGSVYNSIIEVSTADNIKLFNASYSFDISKTHWKILQKSNVLYIANNINLEDIDDEKIENLSLFISESIPIVYDEKIKPNDENIMLFSSIYYYQAAIDALKRSNFTNTEISGTIHPGYLVDKNYFVFQEDQIIDLSLINVSDLQAKVNSVADQNLVNFISSNNTAKVAFSSLNEFCGSAESFSSYLSNLALGGNSTECWIGSGGDIGCCGNYSGCCVYSSVACMIHDTQCASCTPPSGYPAGYCLSGCVPSTPNIPVVKRLVSIGF